MALTIMVVYSARKASLSDTKTPVVEPDIETTRLFNKGDHLIVRGSYGLYTHHGLYVGDDMVVHYSGFADATQPASGPVEKVSLDEFSQGRAIKIREYPDAERIYSRDAACERVESRIGENLYSLLGNNCEHFVMWAITGRHLSPQVRKVSTLSAGTTTLLSGLAGRVAMNAVKRTGLVHTRAVSAMVTVGSTSAAGAVSLMNGTVFRDGEYLTLDERLARERGRRASVLGGTLGTFASLGAVGALGSTFGLSSAGITSGLAAIGGVVGGGVGMGSMLVVAAPAATASVAGFGAYRLVRWLRKDQLEAQTRLEEHEAQLKRFLVDQLPSDFITPDLPPLQQQLTDKS